MDAVGERRNVRADQDDLAALHNDVGFLQIRAAGPNGLDLPAFQGEPGLEPFLDKIIVERFPVFDDAHA